MVGEVEGRRSTSGIVTDLAVGWIKVKKGKRNVSMGYQMRRGMVRSSPD